jgi:hypothetical protein
VLWLAGAVKLHLLLAVLALAAVSCQTARLIDTWTPKDAVAAPYARLMIVGLNPNPGARDRYENTFVDKLSNYDVVAVASINVVPEIADIDRKTVDSWLAEFSLDGVIVTRVSTRKPARHYAPPHDSLSGWYGAWVADSEMATPDEKFYVETDLFDAKSEELLYSAVLKAKLEDDPMETIRAVVDRVAADMRKRGYFPDR